MNHLYFPFPVNKKDHATTEWETLRHAVQNKMNQAYKGKCFLHNMFKRSCFFFKQLVKQLPANSDNFLWDSTHLLSNFAVKNGLYLTKAASTVYVSHLSA